MSAAGNCVLLASLGVLLRMLHRLEHQVGVLGNSHDDDGRIKSFTPLEGMADLDQSV